MIKIVGHDIHRGNEKIGWLEGNKVYDHSGKEVGYFEGNHIYNHTGSKVAYVDGDYIEGSHEHGRIRLEENRKHVEGGTHSDMHRAAIRVLLGD